MSAVVESSSAIWHFCRFLRTSYFHVSVLVLQCTVVTAWAEGGHAAGRKVIVMLRARADRRLIGTSSLETHWTCLRNAEGGTSLQCGRASWIS